MQGFQLQLPASDGLMASYPCLHGQQNPNRWTLRPNLGLIHPGQLQSQLIHFPFQFLVSYLFFILGMSPSFIQAVVWIFLFIVIFSFSISLCWKYGRGTTPNCVAINLMSTLPADIPSTHHLLLASVGNKACHSASCFLWFPILKPKSQLFCSVSSGNISQIILLEDAPELERMSALPPFCTMICSMRNNPLICIHGMVFK